MCVNANVCHVLSLADLRGVRVNVRLSESHASAEWPSVCQQGGGDQILRCRYVSQTRFLKHTHTFLGFQWFLSPEFILLIALHFLCSQMNFDIIFMYNTTLWRIAINLNTAARLELLQEITSVFATCM